MANELTDEQLEKLTKAAEGAKARNLVNVLNKANAGKTLTKRDQEVIGEFLSKVDG